MDAEFGPKAEEAAYIVEWVGKRDGGRWAEVMIGRLCCFIFVLP